MGVAARTIVGFLLAALLIDAFLISGLLFPVRVTSGSMAPALLGPHRAWTCKQCREPFVCSLESLPAHDRPAVCPNCRAANDQQSGVDRPGHRVLVDRATLALCPPQRWEVVVLDCPVLPRQWCVKRVVGLPGERVEVRGGNVWIDGAMAPPPSGVAYIPGSPGSHRQCTLGPGEYFLLGDNGPFSADSRTWPQPGVSRQHIVGRVLAW